MDDDSLQALLSRARQIQEGPGESEAGEDVRLIYEAAEIAGIRREAVDRAIQERLAFHRPTLAPGDLLWSLAADGDFHLATFVEAADGQTSVRFENGATARVPDSATAPFSAVPGNQLDFEERPGRWVRADVLEIRPQERWVYVRLPNGSVRYVAYKDARRRAAVAEETASPPPVWLSPALWAVAAALAASLLTWLVMR